MAFTLERYIGLRPYTFHLTAQGNAARILRDMVIHSATRLLTDANRTDDIRVRRRGHFVVRIGNEDVVIRDQDPLHEGAMEITDGWTFARLLEYINEFIFFWPGPSEDGPISYGLRHFARYTHEQPVIFRVPTRDLIEHNNGNLPYFSKVNSGAPRCSRGQYSPRGPGTFMRCNEAEWDAPRVVELAYRHSVSLPASFVPGTYSNGSWRAQ